MKRLSKLTCSFLLVALCALTPGLSIGKELPKTTHDGLELVENTKLRAVYMKPGASLDQYTRVAIVDVYVAFKKNWERDFNREAIGLGGRISDTDMKEIKQRVAAEFKPVFTKELEKKGHPVVTTSGADVLVLKPAIVNLDVTAPDTRRSFSRSFVSSAGSMVLYLELYDSVTNDIVARIIDPEAAGNTGGMANRATNKQAEDQILRKWADTLAAHLGAVHPADG